MDKFDPWIMIKYLSNTLRADFIFLRGGKDYDLAKRPLCEDWNHESRSFEDLREHVAQGGAVGMRVPSGTIWVDLDKPTGKQWVETHKADLPFYQVTQKGYHVPFREPRERPSGKRTPAGIEVTYRFSGSNQLAVAPSPCRYWVVNRLGDLPVLPDELNTGKTSFAKEIKEIAPQEQKDRPKDTSSIHYLHLGGFYLPIYLEDRPRMPPSQSICCRKMTWRLAHTPKGNRNQTRLELGNLAGSYILGKSLSIQELRWIAWTVQRHSETPQKAVKEFFQAVNHALAVGQARTYGIDRRALAGALKDYFQVGDQSGEIYITNETIRSFGVNPSRLMGGSKQKWIDGQNKRVRTITDLAAFVGILDDSTKTTEETTEESNEPKPASVAGVETYSDRRGEQNEPKTTEPNFRRTETGGMKYAIS